MTLTWLTWLTLTISAAAIIVAGRWRARFGVALILACALAILILHGYLYWDHMADDAYISFRYSHNLAHGNGPVWNPGERVEGYSNFLWVLLLAGTEFVGLGIVEPSRWLGFASTAGTLVVVYALAREMTSDPHEAQVTFAATALLLVATAPLSLWTFAGLEEPLFAFLVALALYVHIREERNGAGFTWSALVAVAAGLTRPEGLMVAGLLFALKSAALVTSQDRLKRLKQLLVWAATFVIPYAMYVTWRLAYYGYPLPNTYYQKLDGAGPFEWQRYRDGYHYVLRFWQQFGLFLLFPLPFLALLNRAARRTATPLLAFITMWAAYVVYVGGDFFYFFRFLVPILPLAYLLSVNVAITGVNRLLIPSVRRQASGVLSLALLAMVAWLIHSPSTPDIRNVRFWDAVGQQNRDITDWMRTQDQQTVVAVYAAGQVPYWSRLPAIDMLGLNDSHIAHQPPYGLDVGPLVPGHRKGDARYVLGRRPDIIASMGTLSLSPVSVLAWKTTPEGLLAAQNDLLRQPDLWALYEPAWVKVPGGVFNFLRLKGSPRVTADLSPAISDQEREQLRKKDLPGSCDNWILPRPPVDGDHGYFYLTRAGVAPGTPRRAETQYHSDVAAAPGALVDLYELFMQQAGWILTGTRHEGLGSQPGVMFGIVGFRAGNDAAARTAFVAVSDDGKNLVTSTDFATPSEPLSTFYRCRAN